MENVKLTEKQQRFIDCYIELGNATEAARRAGYSERSAKQIGNENLTKLDCFIKKRLQEFEDKRIARADEVLKYLTSVMRGEETEEVVVVENLGDFMSRATTIDKEVGAKERIKAAELLGKRYSLFTEKVDITLEKSETFAEIIEQVGGEGLDEEE